jgi:two-component system, OmpR family, response regulator
MGARRVLVIEDETGAREALESLLREEGFTVRSAASGNAGLDDYRSFRPHVVVCDFHLRDINGLQVLQRIREGASGNGARVPFIVLSAGLTGADHERALRSEVDFFFRKPIDPKELHAAIRSLMPPDAGDEQARFADVLT